MKGKGEVRKLYAEGTGWYVSSTGGIQYLGYNIENSGSQDCPNDDESARV